MFQNFFKTAVRVLWKRKSFSIINIMGLAIGIAASLLIFLVIKNEYSYDRYQKKFDRIYRIVTTKYNRSNGEVAQQYSGIPGPLPDAMRLDFPQLERVAAIGTIGTAQIYVPVKNAEEKRFKETEGLFWTEPGIYEIFDYTWIAGSARDLNQPYTVVLNESLAKRFYGNVHVALGNTVQLWSFRVPLRIVGVFKDLPDNTDIPVAFGASFATLRTRLPEAVFGPEGWDQSIGNQHCYILTKKDQSTAALQSQLSSFEKKYYKQEPDLTRQLSFQPLSDLHFNKDFATFKGDALTSKEIWSLGLIGFFLLLVACINFINLTTAQSVNRYKEIGVRKVLGSNRKQLIRQFLQETSLVTLAATLIGCILAIAVLPMLSKLMHKELSINLWLNPSIVIYLLITVILVTLLAGFYPALVLSGFNPLQVFRSKVTTKGSKGIYLRRGLVVFQFVIAQMLIIGTIIVIQQMKYMRNKPLGFSKDGVVLINLPSDSSLRVKYPLLQSRMEQLPGVASTSLCMEAPAMFWSWGTEIYYNNDVEPRKFGASRQFADTGYYKTFGLSLVAGRFPMYHADSSSEVVVNETMVKKLGLKSPEEIIGQRMAFYKEDQKWPVVGVVKDYNSRSLHQEIEPVAISTEYQNFEWLAVRLERSKMNTALPAVEKLFTSIYPTYIYDRFFFDERLEQFYQNESIMLQLFKIFSFLSIFISCLGLYGLVSFMAVQKTREVGIRKVLGASVRSIVFLFSKEFSILVLLSFVISTPVAWYFMQKWLTGFYYHIGISWTVFALAILISITIAWLTVGYKAVRAALVNPVQSLKTE